MSRSYRTSNALVLLGMELSSPQRHRWPVTTWQMGPMNAGEGARWVLGA